MAQGLDELIESLVAEVAFYGDGKLLPPLRFGQFAMKKGIAEGNIHSNPSWEFIPLWTGEEMRLGSVKTVMMPRLSRATSRRDTFSPWPKIDTHSPL